MRVKKNYFNVRVYGILLNDSRQVLITDEYRFEKFITKFPGGGLQFGEGTIDCVKREMKEETGIDIEVISHFYTTDFFQQSAFNESQVISIYYMIRALQPITIEIKEKAFDFPSLTDGAQIFRWISLKELKPEIFSLPIDKKVAKMLREGKS